MSRPSYRCYYCKASDNNRIHLIRDGKEEGAIAIIYANSEEDAKKEFENKHKDYYLIKIEKINF